MTVFDRVAGEATDEAPRGSSGHARRRGPSIHVVRARTLLLAGLAGGLAATVACLIVFGILDGSRGVGSAALGAGCVLFFYAVGQLVMVRFADAGARTLLAVSMASYTARIVILGLLLLAYQNAREQLPALAPVAVFATTIAVVAGWLGVEVIAFSRLRITIFDQGYDDPPAEPSNGSSNGGSGQ